MTYVLGINSAYHESSACLIKNGKVVAMAEEERFTRIKHAKKARVDNPDDLPWKSISFCLEQAGIELPEVDYVGFSIDPKERIKMNKEHVHPYCILKNSFGTLEGEEIFYEKSKSVEKNIYMAGFKGKFIFLSHHDCHAASTFLVSPFKKAAILVIDGIGEFDSTTLYSGNDKQLKKIKAIFFPNSLGFLWEKVCKYMGFSEYDSCRLMGLASYGDPHVYWEKMARLVSVEDNGLFTINDAFACLRNEEFNQLEKLFELPKRHESVRIVNEDTQRYADLAATLQKITEEIIVKLARFLKSETGSSNLCIAGGVALNCVANNKIAEAKIFDKLFIQPAANDASTALGACYLIWNTLLGNNRTYEFESPFLGPEFSPMEVKDLLKRRGLNYEYVEHIEEKTALLLASGNVVGWFQGRMEVGPRALGNRSILFDPRRKDAVKHLNEKVKHREPFRPFCPSVLSDKVGDWFTFDSCAEQPARYMLVAVSVVESKRVLVPAIVHVDGTARIQIVNSQSNLLFYKLIKEFEKITGVPILLNTSFNDQEPIVCTPQDALATFLKTNIDYLVIGNYLISRRNNHGN